MHRPHMDWEAAARRADPATLEGRVFAGLRRLASLRATLPQLRAGGQTVPWSTDNPAVFAFLRTHRALGACSGW